MVLSYGLWQRLFGAERRRRGPVALAQRRELRGRRRDAGGVPRRLQPQCRAVGAGGLPARAVRRTISGRTSSSISSPACGRACRWNRPPRRSGRWPSSSSGQYPDDYSSDWSLVTTPLAQRTTGTRAPGAARAPGRRRVRAAHRLRERRQPAARPRRGALEGDRRPHRARRQPGAPAAPAPDREPAARAGRRCARSRARATGACALRGRVESRQSAPGGRDRDRRVRDALSRSSFRCSPACCSASRPPCTPRPPICTAMLKEGGRGSAGDRGGQGLRRMLVVAEVALALTLLTGAGLLVKSFARLQGVDPGFDPDQLLTFNLALPPARYPVGYPADRLLRPGPARRSPPSPACAPRGPPRSCRSAAAGPPSSFEIEGYQPPPKQPGPWGDIRIVSPGFFETLRIPLRRGRTLADQDRAGAPRGRGGRRGVRPPLLAQRATRSASGSPSAARRA